MEQTEMQGIATLAKKLAIVMGKVSRLGKSGQMGTNGYKFITVDDMVDMIRPLLADNNVALIASVTSSEISVVTTSNDKKMNHATVTASYTLVCGDTGATLTAAWQGEATDTGDKALNKATTAALKYWLKSTFMVSTGDEEADSTSEEFTQPKVTTVSPKSPPAKIAAALPPKLHHARTIEQIHTALNDSPKENALPPSAQQFSEFAESFRAFAETAIKDVPSMDVLKAVIKWGFAKEKGSELEGWQFLSLKTWFTGLHPDDRKAEIALIWASQPAQVAEAS